MYEDYYGFTARPFQLTPDPRFWVETASHKKAMAYLGYGLAQGEGFIVITGDIGAGKTTLVGHLMATIDRGALHTVTIVSSQVEPEDLLRTVAEGLEVATAGLPKSALLGAIERQLHALARGGKRALLVVDEVQALPMASLEELRMLSNFQSAGHALLQIVLLGQPEFRARIADPRLEQLRQRVIATHHLSPMAADEVELYIAQRLTIAGWSGRPDFSPEALALMHAWSGGVPRKLNQLANRVLLHGSIERIDAFSAGHVAAVIADLEGDAVPAAIVGEPTPDAIARVAQAANAPVMLTEPQPLPIVIERVDEAAALPVPAPAIEPDRAAAIDEPPVMAPEPARPMGQAPTIAAEPAAAVDAALFVAPRPARAVDSALAVAVEAAAAAGPATEPAAYQPAVPPVEPSAPEAPVTPFAAVEEHASGEPVFSPQAEVAPEPVDYAARFAAIEARMEEQDAALRRVLTLLVDWVESDGARRGDAAKLRPDAA